MTSTASPPRPWRLVSTAWALLAIGLTGLIFRCFQEDQTQSGTWGCEMSYMWPTYHKVEWSENPSSKYSLWLYREQGWDRDMRPTGHPVVFVPGNAGSFKQVRSIASSAARQYYTESGGRAEGMEDKISLDFFAVDYNEDFSAFHAATLRDQADFLAQSVRHVLEQYTHLPGSSRPLKVTLLGHSMGGIAARLALQELTGLVDVILTMSTPHAIPPVTLELGMDTIWRSLGRQSHNHTSPLLFSICGGTADTQIASDACVIPSESLGTGNGFTIFTTGMPGTWTSVEHQAMVWCHQVRWRVARTLLEMTALPERRDKLAAAEEWLLGQRRTVEAPSGRTTRIPVTSKLMCIMITSPAFDHASILRWCRSEGDCQHINVEETIIPAPLSEDAPFPLPGEGIKPEEQAVVLNVNLAEAIGWLEVKGESPHVVGDSASHKTRSGDWSRPHEATYAYLGIDFEDTSTSSLLVHRLDIQTKACQGHRPTIRYRAAPAPGLDNAHEARFFPNAPATVYLHAHSSSAPFISSGPKGLSVDIYQHPSCQVTDVNLSVAYGASLAKMVTRFRMAAVAWIVAWVAVAWTSSIGVWQTTGMFVPLPTMLDAQGRQGFLKVTGMMVILSTSAHISLGLGELVLLPFVAILAIWTFAVVNLVSFVLETLLSAPSLVATRRKHDEIARAPAPLRSVVLTALPALLAVHFLIPHQMAFLILLVIMLVATATEEPHSGRFNYMASVALFMVTLVPFNAPVLAVWGRNIWADFRHPFPADYDIFRILPLMMLVSLAVSGRTPRPKRRLVDITKITLMVFATLAFMFGPRRTWIIPYMADIIYIELSLLMVD